MNRIYIIKYKSGFVVVATKLKKIIVVLRMVLQNSGLAFDHRKRFKSFECFKLKKKIQTYPTKFFFELRNLIKQQTELILHL